MQTVRQSAIETAASTSVGFVGSWIIVYVTFLLVRDPVVAATVATGACTVWSFVRGFTFRRFFAKREETAR